MANIFEWVQCFSIFTAVCTQKYPEKTQYMLGYLALIVEVHMEYEGNGWLGYDRQFRQNAALTNGHIVQENYLCQSFYSGAGMHLTRCRKNLDSLF